LRALRIVNSQTALITPAQGDKKPRPKHGEEVAFTPRTATQYPNGEQCSQRKGSQEENRSNQLFGNPRKNNRRDRKPCHQRNESQASSTTDGPESLGIPVLWGGHILGNGCEQRQTTLETNGRPYGTDHNSRKYDFGWTSEGADNIRDPEHSTRGATPRRPPRKASTSSNVAARFMTWLSSRNYWTFRRHRN